MHFNRHLLNKILKIGLPDAVAGTLKTKDEAVVLAIESVPVVDAGEPAIEDEFEVSVFAAPALIRSEVLLAVVSTPENAENCRALLRVVGPPELLLLLANKRAATGLLAALLDSDEEL